MKPDLKGRDLRKEWQKKVDTAFCVLEVDINSILFRIRDINKCKATPTVFVSLDKHLEELIPEIQILLDRLKEKTLTPMGE